MTEDYKNKLLKFLTGKIDKETKENNPYFREKKSNETNVINLIREAVGDSWQIYDTVLAKDKDGNYNGKAYSYGYGNDGTKNNYFILLTESSNTGINLLKVFTSYSSGTSFQDIEYMGVDEKGQCYICENTTNGRRIVLLNNISVKSENVTDYSVILRTSYYLQGAISTIQSSNTKVKKIVKSLNNAYYLFYADEIVSNTQKVYLTQLKINVGSENEWIDYNTDVIPNLANYLDIYAIWGSEDNITINIWYKLTNDLIMYNNTDTTIKLQNRFYSFTYDVFFPNEEAVYYVGYTLYATGENKAKVILEGNVKRENKYYLGINFTTINNTEYNTYFEKIYLDIEHNVESFGNILYTTLINDTICCIEIRDYSDSATVGYVGNIVFLLFDNEYYGELISDNVNFLREGQYIFIVQNIFNLYTYNFAYDDTDKGSINIGVKTIYNSLNYNGLPYENNDMLIPTTSNLYDNDNNLIFARNLYNKTVNGNITTSTVQVPNTMLNNIVINEKELLGKTNVSLVKDQGIIEKNIYETLNINFINKITIENRNDPENPIINELGAIRLNNSISNLADYENAKGLNINIVYDDNTNYSYNLDINQIEVIDTTVMIDLYVYVPLNKNITQIEIRSIDTKTVYQTITNLNLEKGKYYNINQNVEVQ